MKIGYPCINWSMNCSTNKNFRLANYSEERLKDCVGENLKCLKKILEWNVNNEILFFRIGSQLVPFASHPICKFKWQKYFKKEFEEIGKFVLKNKIRISMHPDQFVLINSPKEEVVSRSIKELEYHADVLDLMKLKQDAKIQIHVGGVYGDKKRAIESFVKNYALLPLKIKKRLVIENDDKLYSVKECIEINKKCGIPILFDNFHHECLNNGENIKEALIMCKKTWKNKDGLIMTDYSCQNAAGIKGKHAQSINIDLFRKYIKDVKEVNFDVMLEIKDKEKSALKAIEAIK